MPIGMSSVSSVNFGEHIKEGSEVSKGDEMGWFQFGGSDFIMVFQKQVEVALDVPRNNQNDSYKHLLMGERYARLIKKTIAR